MNPEQVKSGARSVIVFVGGALVGWASSRGWQWGDVLNQLLSSETFMGIAVAAAAALWGVISKSAPNLVAIVNALSGVKGVITEPTPEGVKLAQAVPAPTVVPAGTTAAATVAAPVK